MNPPERDIRGFNLRPAGSSDLAGIASIKLLTWPEEPVREDCIAHVLDSESHTTLIVEQDGQIAGFLSCFVTVGKLGRRWENDLLAVGSAFRGQGLGKWLVSESCRLARQHNVWLCRALVQVDNLASQHCFQHNGFQQDGQLYRLYISSSPLSGLAATVSAMDLLPVTTMNYRGVWIENSLNADILRVARCALSDLSLDLAGVLIPVEDETMCRIALSLGYEEIEDYHWWYSDQNIVP